MPISLHIEVNTVAEYREAIAAFAGTSAPAMQTSAWQRVPDDELRRMAQDAAAGEAYVSAKGDNLSKIEVSAAEDVTEEVAAAEAPKRKRGRPTKAAEAAPEPAEEAAPEPEQAAPNPFEADADTGADDKQAALVLMRALYDRPGLPAKVNAYLAHFGVEKFSAVPDSRGTEFLEIARKLDAENPA